MRLMSLPWKRLLQLLILLVAIGFVVALVYSQWAALSAYRWHFAPAWGFVALLGLELSWLVELDTWRFILRSLGGNLSYGQAARIWFISNIIRYIPGNVWQFLGMVEMAAGYHVPRLATLSSIVLHQAISTAAGLVLAALYFATYGEAQWAVQFRPVLWLVPLGLLLLQPRILEWILNGILRRFHRPPLLVTLTWGQVWVLLGRYLVVWTLVGLSFAALIRALTPIVPQQLPFLGASWAAGYVIGYLSLLTPSGLGVREGVLALLLGPMLTPAVAAVAVLVARLWMVIGEIIGAGTAFVIARRLHDPWLTGAKAPAAPAAVAAQERS
jgi:glycosyltransferase 2 family protein